MNTTSDNIAPAVKVKNLAEKTILVSINIGTFSTNKKDKKQSKATAEDVGGSSEYIRVNKSLLRNKATADVLSFSQAMRLKFYKLALPWGNDGFRIVKIANYVKIKSELEENIRKFNELVDLAVEEYKTIVNNGFKTEKDSLGSMFNEKDYPSIANFRASFYAETKVKPVEVSDFRSNSLSNEEVAEINSSIQSYVEDSLKAAEFDVLSRIGEKLDHLKNRLMDYDSKFHTSNITNLKEVIEEARELNINDNPKIKSTIDSIEAQIKDLDAVQIREDKGNTRTDAVLKTVQAIKEINEAMADFSF